MYDASELRNGHFIENEGKLLKVLTYHHNKTGRGGAVIKVKVKNVISNSITELTLRPGDKFKPADITRQKYQYLYHEGDTYHFMNTEDFNQIVLNKDVLDTSVDFLTENLEVYLVFWGERAIGVGLPPSVTMKVVYTEQGVKGDTVSGAKKVAKTASGYELQVPLFVNNDTLIKVSTETGEYLERA